MLSSTHLEDFYGISIRIYYRLRISIALAIHSLDLSVRLIAVNLSILLQGFKFSFNLFLHVVGYNRTFFRTLRFCGY